MTKEKNEVETPVQPEGVHEDMVRQINAAAEKLRVENERFEANQKLLEAQRVEKMLAGKSEVGVPKKEETPKEYKDRVMRGEI